MAVLSDCSAYFLHLGLRSWLKATDSGHAASAFASSLAGPVSGVGLDVLRVPAVLPVSSVCAQSWLNLPVLNR